MGLGEPDNARKAFQNVIDYGEEFATLPNAATLVEKARSDMLSVGKPMGASSVAN